MNQAQSPQPPSDWFTVTQPEAVRLILDMEARAVLEQFILQRNTIKAVAEQLNRPLNAVHHRVKQFERLGLLRIEQLETRPGRAVKHYRAVAKGFFVPFTLSNVEELSGFLRQQMIPMVHEFLDDLVHSAASLIQDITEVGFRVYDGGGFLSRDFSPQGQQFDFFQSFLNPEAPALMYSFFPLQLSKEAAKSLQHEMLELLQKYSHPSGTETYMAQIGLTSTNQHRVGL